jgi:hypothetical protein
VRFLKRTRCPLCRRRVRTTLGAHALDCADFAEAWGFARLMLREAERNGYDTSKARPYADVLRRGEWTRVWLDDLPTGTDWDAALTELENP